MDKSVSIVGCGWLGIPLADELQKQGYRVKGSTTQATKIPSLASKGIEPYLLDLSVLSKAEDWTAFLNSSYVVVLLPPKSRTQAAGIYEKNISTFMQLLLPHQKTKHVIYTSSTSVYPDTPTLLKEESIQDSGRCGFPELRRVEELFLQLPFKSTVLRLGGLTGGSRMLARHFAGKQNIPGGACPVNLLHLEDAIGAICFMLKKELQGIFNVCSPQHPSKKDFYTRLAIQHHMPVPVFAEDDLQGKTIDVSKLLAAGYSFRFEDPFAFTYEQ